MAKPHRKKASAKSKKPAKAIKKAAKPPRPAKPAKPARPAKAKPPAKNPLARAAAAPANPWAALAFGAANYAALSPITFLPRAAEIHPDRIAVVHGTKFYNYARFYQRARRLASALALRA